METGVHRVIGIVLGLVFASFAVVQYNDPDPLTWISVYGFMVLLVVVSILQRLPVVVSLVPMLAAIVGAVLLWPDRYMGLEKGMDSHINIELARESLGLGICALGCGYVGVRSLLRGRNATV
jgi:hypothetical protein